MLKPCWENSGPITVLMNTAKPITGSFEIQKYNTLPSMISQYSYCALPPTVPHLKPVQ